MRRSRAARTWALIGILGLGVTALASVDVDDVRGITLRLAARRYWRTTDAIRVAQDSLPLQRFGYDCGQAALALAWRVIGGPADAVAQVESVLPRRVEGVTTDELRAAALRLGLRVDRVAAGAFAALRGDRPSIALLPVGHFVVVFPDGTGGVRVFDPLAGLYSVRANSLETLMHVGAIAIDPGPP